MKKENASFYRLHYCDTRTLPLRHTPQSLTTQCRHLLIKRVAVAACAPCGMRPNSILHAGYRNSTCTQVSCGANKCPCKLQSACNGHAESKGHSCKQSRSKLEGPCIYSLHAPKGRHDVCSVAHKTALAICLKDLLTEVPSFVFRN